MATASSTAAVMIAMKPGRHPSTLLASATTATAGHKRASVHSEVGERRAGADQSE